MTPGIDFGGIVATTDLRAMIEAELGPPDRSGKWRCPFHDDHSPSMGLTPDGKRFRCWSCGTSGTAVDWIMQREGISVVEAARRLDPLTPVQDRHKGPWKPRGGVSGGGVAGKTVLSPESLTGDLRRPPFAVVAPPVEEAPKQSPVWSHPDWQAEADQVICEAEDRLWTPEGAEALAWLRRRGFHDRTIRFFRLGFVAAKFRTPTVEALGLNGYGKPQGFHVDRGIIIPRLAPGAWFPTDESPDSPRWSGVKVRRLLDDLSPAADGIKWPKTDGPKFRALTGSNPGFLYPFDDLVPGVPCVVCEGEMDALIAFQAFGHLANVATTSGATQGPTPEALAALRRCSAILIGTDWDEAGDKSADEWRARFPGQAKRLYLPADPPAKDLTDFHVRGGDLRAWFGRELERLGIT